MHVLTWIGGRNLSHVVLSEEMRVELARRYAVREVLVCNNAIFVDHSSGVPERSMADCLSLGHYGNLTFEKGLDAAIRTQYELLARGINAELKLAGPISGQREAELVDAAVSKGGSNISWAGPLDQCQVDQFLCQIDLLLFPSTYVNEAQPLVVLEAARLGIPCIAYDHGSLDSVVATSDLLIDTESDYAVTAADIINQLLSEGRFEELKVETLSMYAEHRATSAEVVELLVRDFARGCAA